MRGPTGTKWIQAQLQRLNRWCIKWRIALVLQQTDDNIYDVTLWALDGHSITVRVTTWGYLEYGIDVLLRPDHDDWSYVQKWIKQHGLRPKKWTPNIARQLSTRIEQALSGYDVYYADKQWGPELTIRNGLITVATLDELGLHIEDTCPIMVRLALQRVVPKEYQI